MMSSFAHCFVTISPSTVLGMIWKLSISNFFLMNVNTNVRRAENCPSLHSHSLLKLSQVESSDPVLLTIHKAEAGQKKGELGKAVKAGRRRGFTSWRQKCLCRWSWRWSVWLQPQVDTDFSKNATCLFTQTGVYVIISQLLPTAKCWNSQKHPF